MKSEAGRAKVEPRRFREDRRPATRPEPRLAWEERSARRSRKEEDAADGTAECEVQSRRRVSWIDFVLPWLSSEFRLFLAPARTRLTGLLACSISLCVPTTHFTRAVCLELCQDPRPSNHGHGPGDRDRRRSRRVCASGNAQNRSRQGHQGKCGSTATRQLL